MLGFLKLALHLPNSIVADSSSWASSSGSSTRVVEKRDMCATPLNYLMVISPYVSCISSFGKSIQKMVGGGFSIRLVNFHEFPLAPGSEITLIRFTCSVACSR